MKEIRQLRYRIPTPAPEGAAEKPPKIEEVD
jgi:hypothetical protein